MANTNNNKKVYVEDNATGKQEATVQAAAATAADGDEVEEEEEEESKSDRALLAESYFYKTYKIGSEASQTSDESCALALRKFFISKKKNAFSLNCYKEFLFKAIPILDWLPKYNVKSSLAPDLIAGNTVGIMNIPQG